jgi:hypothetical protein
MKQIITISKKNLDEAFEQVNYIVLKERNDPALNSIFDGALSGRIESVWASIHSTIQKAFLYGKEAVTNAVDAVYTSIDNLLQIAGTRAAEVYDEILKRLRVFMKTLLDSALNLIPSFMVISETRFEMSKINYGQKLIIGGSLKTNLFEVLELTSGGEFELSVEYERNVTTKN